MKDFVVLEKTLFSLLSIHENDHLFQSLCNTLIEIQKLKYESFLEHIQLVISKIEKYNPLKVVSLFQLLNTLLEKYPKPIILKENQFYRFLKNPETKELAFRTLTLTCLMDNQNFYPEVFSEELGINGLTYISKLLEKDMIISSFEKNLIQKSILKCFDHENDIITLLELILKFSRRILFHEEIIQALCKKLMIFYQEKNEVFIYILETFESLLLCYKNEKMFSYLVHFYENLFEEEKFKLFILNSYIHISFKHPDMLGPHTRTINKQAMQMIHCSDYTSSSLGVLGVTMNLINEEERDNIMENIKEFIFDSLFLEDEELVENSCFVFLQYLSNNHDLEISSTFFEQSVYGLKVCLKRNRNIADKAALCIGYFFKTYTPKTLVKIIIQDLIDVLPLSEKSEVFFEFKLE